MPNKLELDEATHRYTLDGRKLIGVTQALSILDDRWKVDPFYLQRGQFIHKATELYDRDELDESTIDERIRPYLDAYIRFKADTGFVPDPNGIELLLHHPSYFYAGALDRYGFLNNNLVIIDLKSGAPAKVDELQAVAYRELCRANNLPITKQFDLYLKNNGTYKLEPIEKPKLLLPVFLACLKVTQYKEGL